MVSKACPSSGGTRKGAALYVHVPFCLKRCLYCDFLSYGGASLSRRWRYHQALLRDLEDNSCFWPGSRSKGKVTSPKPVISSIYFGGGTPTTAKPEWLKELLDKINSRFEVSPHCEITLEANPGTVSADSLEFLRRAGFNRLSLGVQSLDPPLLQELGRIHTAEQVFQSVANGKKAGFVNFNLDVIYGLPGQSLASWQSTLEGILELKPTHLAAYALSVEKGTPLAEGLKRGLYSLPSGSTVYKMERCLRSSLAGRGFEHYEISNWAQAGFQCRHNLAYWLDLPYYAFGCGATAYLNKWRFRRWDDEEAYCQAIENGYSPIKEGERLSQDEQFKEQLMLRLRLRRGLNLPKLCCRFRQEYAHWREFFDRLPSYLIVNCGERLHLSGRGRDISNEIFLRIME